MRRTRTLRASDRSLLVVLTTVAILSVVAPAPRAEELPGLAEALVSRSPWWPLERGPHYGDLAPDWPTNPRAIRLEVGSFDTRSAAGLDLPASLRFASERALRPTSPWIVQLEGPITEAKKDALRARGVWLYDYLPQNAFVVRTAEPAMLASLPGVLFAGPYHPAYRIEPLLGTAPTFDPVKARNETLFVRARLFEPGEREATVAAIEALGGTVDRVETFDPRGWADAVYFAASPRVLLSVAALDAVRWVEEVSREGHVMNAESQVVMQSGFLANGTPFWNAGVDGSTQVVGDMDNGMDVDTILLSHTAADAGAPGASHRKVVAYTAYGGGDLLSCGNYSHGTNTAQCAVGNRGDFGLDPNLEGVAKKARVVFQDLTTTNTFNCLLGQLSPPATLFAAYDEVRAKGGHLTNGSFSICSGYGSHASDVDQYSWDHKDFLGFFSAGNGGNGIVCPGTAKNVIAAGGYYQDPFFTFYGATGPAPSGRMGPTVMAPACDQTGGNPAPYDFNTSTSLQSADTNITGTPEAILSQGSCGTSFSSPYAMGAGALVRDYFEKGFYPSGSANAADGFAPTGALVKAVLMNSGEHMSCCGSLMESTTTYGQGMGRVNLSRTLPITGSAVNVRSARVFDKGAAVGLATGGTFETTVEVDDASVPLRATVVWTDRVGSALVNNLRLTVIGPSGGASQTYHGGNFVGQYSRSESAGGTANDGVNPFEAVRVNPSELVTGTWTVRVSGTNVPNGDPNYGNTQPFALIVSGAFAPAVREVSPPGSGSPLVVAGVAGADVSWQWELVSGSGNVYDLYRGDLVALHGSGSYTHGKIDAARCGIATNSGSVPDRLDGLDRYYLVGMRQGTTAGPLGNDSADAARPAASPPCP